MRLSRVFQAFLLLGPVHASDPRVSDDGSYIVECDSLDTSNDHVFAKHGLKLAARFKSDVFSGAVLESDALPVDVDTIRRLPGVLNVWNNKRIIFDEPQPTLKSRAAGQADPINSTTHMETGVFELHRRGIRGKGAKVAVVDVGVNYMHPALGGGIGKGFKVAGGWNIADDNSEKKSSATFGLLTKIPVSQVTQCQEENPSGHGTHVAGIVAGNSTGWVGVAPEATIYAYRVQSGGNEAEILDAYLRAFNDGVDIITSSLGAASGWPGNALAEIVTRMVEAGVVVTISAGNAASEGPFMGTTLSASPLSLTVSNIDTTSKPLKMDSRSSWATTNELDLKPDVGAPGTDIYSTWLNDEFELLSGTSMSTPYVAGVAALWVGAYGGRHVHGKGVAKMLRQRIISSGRSVSWHDDSRTLPSVNAPVSYAGTGLVNAVAVIDATTYLQGAKMNLNDTTHFNANHQITIVNDGNDTVTYTFAVEHDKTVNSIAEIDGERYLANPSQMTFYDNAVDVTLPSPVTIKAGEQKTVPISFTNPARSDGWPTDLLPIYSGKVIISSSINNETLAAPFMGVAADLKSASHPWMAMSDEFYWPQMLVGFYEGPYHNHSTFTFNLSTSAQDYPLLTLSYLLNPKEVRWDIFEANWTECHWTYPPKVGKNGFVGSATYWPDPLWYEPFDPETMDATQVSSFPLYKVARGKPYRFPWLGSLADGSHITDGSYRMRVASLKPFGDPENAHDWWKLGGLPLLNVTIGK